jgi:hypothetical protein
MGKPGYRNNSLISVQVDTKIHENGTVIGGLKTINTDLIVKQGSNKNKIVQSKMSDIKEKVNTLTHILYLNIRIAS